MNIFWNGRFIPRLDDQTVDYSLENRLSLASECVDRYLDRHKTLPISKDFEIAVRQFLFEYFMIYETSFLFSSQSLKGILRGRIIVRRGIREFSYDEQLKQFFFPSNYSSIFFPIRYFLEWKQKFKKSVYLDHENEIVAIGSLPDLTVWSKVTKFINRPSCALVRPKFHYTPFCTHLPDELNKTILAELKTGLEFLPQETVNLFKHKLYSIYSLIRKYQAAKVFVLFDESSWETSLVAYLIRRIGRIPITMAHATTFGENYKHLACDYGLLFGQSSFDSFCLNSSIRCGLPVKIGSPKDDYLFEMPVKKPKGNGDILFLPSWIFPGQKNANEKSFKMLQEVFHQIPNKLIVKQHPVRDNPLVNKYLISLRNVEVITQMNLLDLIDKCDIVITSDWSNAALETIIRGRNHIWLNPQRLSDFYGFLKFGYSYETNDSLSLIQAIQKIKNKNYDINESARRNIIDYHFDNQGVAAQIAAKFIENLF